MFLNNILRNAAHTTDQEPSPVSPAVPRPSHTADTGRPRHRQSKQASDPTLWKKGQAGQEACRPIWLQRQTWVQSHEDMSTNTKKRPLASVAKPVKQLLSTESGLWHLTKLMAVELQIFLLCPGLHPAPRLSPGLKYLMSTYFMLGTVLSSVNRKIMAQFSPSISLQPNEGIK